MKISLFDELLADAIGMKPALGYFHADLFRDELGLNLDDTIQNNGRIHVYRQK